MSSKRYAGKVVIVTGGGLGMGRAIALRLASEGARVAVLDINESAAESTVAAVRASGGSAQLYRCDIASTRDVEVTVAAVVRDAGALHVLINNAGIMHPDDDLLEHTSDAAWDRTLAVNFLGPFHCCRFSIPHLLGSGGGAIVSIASIGGVMGTTRPVYGASKGAVIGMTSLIARQYAAQGLRANVVLPGGVNTPMLEVVMKYRRTVRQPVYNPLQRVAEPEEIAGVVAYLASDDAAGVNGALWPVDGGTLAV
jgi:NAD(P)-dependent dehydrogenase (short-subunit alcohol dehydrogenase family)